MIKIERVDVFGWEAAIRGMRNPLESWEKSDSRWCYENQRNKSSCSQMVCDDCIKPFYEIGENDLKLMKSLVEAGTDHRKFLRMINVTCDIVAPLYWWAEYDTYKVGTVANSCSTMHKIADKEFTLDDFSHEHLTDKWSDENELIAYNGEYNNAPQDVLEFIIDALNLYRIRYIQTKDKKYWYDMIQILPTSFNQRRTVQLNYEVLHNMYHARKSHVLDEWVEFCEWIETLPYSELITG